LVLFDGSTYCATADTASPPPGDDWALVAAKGADARQGRLLGLWDAHRADYGQFDRVSFNGSEWIAKKDNPGPLPGDGWMMGAKVGKPGPKGERGATGPAGKNGAAIKAIRLDEDYGLILDMTEGKPIRVDLRALFERYDSEVRA